MDREDVCECVIHYATLLYRYGGYVFYGNRDSQCVEIKDPSLYGAFQAASADGCDLVLPGNCMIGKAPRTIRIPYHAINSIELNPEK